MTQRTVVAVALAVATCATAGPALAADFPQWRGPARDGLIVGLAPRGTWPEALKPAWKTTVGAGHSSPVVVGDRVFQFSRIGDDEVVQALEVASGKSVWRQSYKAPYTMNMAATSHGKGPKATPLVEDGRVFTLGISGILSAFDAATGRPLWRKEFGTQFKETSPLYGAATSPVMDQGRLIVYVGGNADGALTAFAPATGAILWAFKGDGPAYTSPVVADLAGVRQIVTMSDASLVGVSAEKGELLWKLPFTTAYTQNAVTPVIRGDLVIYGGLEHAMQAVRITRSAAGLVPQPVWENPEVANYMSSPVLVGDRLYGLSHKRKGQLYCLDALTGKTIWLSEARQGENASLLAGGGALFVLTTDSELLVASLEGATFSVRKRYPVATSPTWAHPVVLPEGVLVKDAESLAFLKF